MLWIYQLDLLIIQRSMNPEEGAKGIMPSF